MEFESYLILLAYTLITGFGLHAYWTVKRANPVFWFLVLQYLMASGTIMVADMDSESDSLYVMLYFLFLLCFLGGAVFGSSMVPLGKASCHYFQSPVIKDRAIVMRWVFYLVGFSALVTVIYYALVGHNFVAILIQGGTIENYSDMRLKGYGGEQYYAPGYANQFKNVLLPVGLSILAMQALYTGKKRKLYVYLALGLPFVIYALLGTGQRAFIVHASIAFVFGLSLLMGGRSDQRNLPWPVLLTGAAFVFILFSLFSYLYHEASIKDSGHENLVVATVNNVFNRIFFVNQEQGLIGFRYLHALNRHDATEWLKELWGISPFYSYKAISHEIFYHLYLTDRGTAPLTVVGNAYYSGGTIGLATYAFLMGFGYTIAYYMAINGKRTIYRAMVYGPLCYYLSLNTAGSPMTLFNRGVVALFIMLWISNFLAPDRKRITRPLQIARRR